MQNTVTYTELGQTTEAQLEYVCSYGGGFYLHTSIELKGRGIKKTGNGENHKRNLKSYRVTELALNKLKENYSSSYMANL